MRRLIAAIGLLALAATTLVAGPAGSTAEPATAEPTVWPRLYEQLPLDSFIKDIEGLLANRFGGTWMTGEGRDAVLHVGVRNPTATDEHAIAALAGAGAALVVVNPVRYSYEQLLDFRARVDATVGEAKPTGSVAVGLRTDTNLVGVEITRADEALVPRINASVPADAVSITVIEGGLTATTMDTRRTYPPYKAGRDILLLNSATVAGNCTSAFDVIIKDGPNAGLDQGTTSGHCGPNNRTVTAGPGHTITVGVTNLNSFFCCQPTAPGDAVLIGFANQLDATNKLFVTDTLSRSVTSKIPNPGLGVGTHLCKSGLRTGITCGDVDVAPPVTIFNVSYYDWETGRDRTKNIANLACFKGNSNSGDSGGPVYDGTGNSPPTAGAGGILSLRRERDGAFYDTCFDTIDNALGATGTRLRKS